MIPPSQVREEVCVGVRRGGIRFEDGRLFEGEFTPDLAWRRGKLYNSSRC